MIISTEEGPIEIIETTLGTSYVDGQSWNIPAALTPGRMCISGPSAKQTLATFDSPRLEGRSSLTT
jgi:hypothetical protein